MAIPKETIEEIRSRCNIVDVITSYLPELRRRGSTYKCNCPFHQEKTPSFTVNEERQIYHCFGCGAGGDVFRFIMEYDKIDFISAVQLLGDRVGVEVLFEGKASENQGSKEKLLNLHTDAAAFYHRTLLQSKEAEHARAYLRQRRLSEEIVKDFQIGYAPNEWDSLLKGAMQKGYSPEEIEKAGLVVVSDKLKKKSHYDRFRNRLLFPICDHMGRVIGFSGRALDKKDNSAKYINSPETMIFRKSRVLFAFDKARKTIVDKKQAIIVEGQIDAIRCHHEGLRQVVASQGTALTEQHAKFLKRYTDEIVLVFDADEAGIKAALTTSELFIAEELSVRVAILPEKEDPDSLICNKGVEVFQKILEQAPGALDYLIRVTTEKENIHSEVGKKRVCDAVMRFIQKSPSSVWKESMILRAAKQLNISAQALSKDMRRLPKQVRTEKVEEKKSDHKVIPKVYPLEEIKVLQLFLVHHKEVRALIEEWLPYAYINDTDCRFLIEQLASQSIESFNAIRSQFSAGAQNCLSKAEIGLIRIDSDTTAIDLMKMYILNIWSHVLEQESKALSIEKRMDFNSTIRKPFDKRTRSWEEATAIMKNRLYEDK